MANPGIPTTSSHDRNMDDLLHEFNGKIIEAYNICNSNRTDMAAGAVGDDTIKELWNRLADIHTSINRIRKTSNFADEYAKARGLVYRFNCTDDVNAATEKITNLPANHGFLTDHRVDFSIIEGALPGGLSEETNYWVRTVDAPNGTITLSATEGGASDINLSNGTGKAWMRLNIRPDISSLVTALATALTEIETNLTQRSSTYGSRTTQEHTYSTRDTTATATLRGDLQDIEDLIDAS